MKLALKFPRHSVYLIMHNSGTEICLPPPPRSSFIPNGSFFQRK